jgi:hypothetical protein
MIHPTQDLTNTSLSLSLSLNENLQNRRKLPTEPEDSPSTTAATVIEVFFSFFFQKTRKE